MSGTGANHLAGVWADCGVWEHHHRRLRFQWRNPPQSRGALVLPGHQSGRQRSGGLIGQVKEKQVYDGDGTTLLRKSSTNYATETFAAGKAKFTYAQSVTSYQYDDGGNSIATKVQYEYNTSYQNGSQYGNITHIYEYDDANAATPYRTTRRWYYPNTTNWVVDKLAAEAVYAGNSWTVLNGSWTYYDNTSPNTPPTQGFTTRIRQFESIACGEMPSENINPACVNARKTMDTAFTSDEYGNPATTTTYSDYGYRSFDSSWAEIENVYPTDGITSTITYDGGYHLYPTAVSDGMTGHPPTTFEIYGFNGVALDGFQTQPGLLKKVTDPNKYLHGIRCSRAKDKDG